MNKTILLFKLAIDKLSAESQQKVIESYHEYLSNQLDSDILFFIIPSKENDIVCLNPKIITEDALKKEVENLIKELQVTLNQFKQ